MHKVIKYDPINQNVIKVTTAMVLNYGYEIDSIEQCNIMFKWQKLDYDINKCTWVVPKGLLFDHL